MINGIPDILAWNREAAELKMNSWRWQTIAASIVAGICVVSMAIAGFHYGIEIAASDAGWSLFGIPAGVLFSAFVLPGSLVALIFLHARRQEIVDRCYHDEPNP
jgi:TRAP-type C4-dicarboxylate transport system permease small subunit